jgi:hypothetical protein
VANNAFNSLREFKLKSGKTGKYYSLAALEEAGLGKVSRLPVSLRVVLESVLRNCDGKSISEDRVRELAGWQPTAPRTQEIPFVLARIMLQDMAGFPALNDFAAMRAEAKRQNFEPTKIEPLVPVDLVVDHSVMIDEFGTPRAFQNNVDREYERNMERYVFLKWGQNAFNNFRVVPPGTGICHQVNLEYLAQTVWTDTDQHGKPRVYTDGPNVGKPRVTYDFAVAILDVTRVDTINDPARALLASMSETLNAAGKKGLVVDPDAAVIRPDRGFDHVVFGTIDAAVAAAQEWLAAGRPG